MTSIEERLRRLEDAETARNHVYAYASTLDGPTPEAVADLFAEDAVLHVPAGTFTGRAQIADFFRNRLAAQGSDRRHFVSNPQVRHLAPGLVQVDAYFAFTRRDAGRSSLGWGRYLDTIRIVDGAALFTEKTITPHVFTDLASGWPAP